MPGTRPLRFANAAVVVPTISNGETMRGIFEGAMPNALRSSADHALFALSARQEKCKCV